MIAGRAGIQPSRAAVIRLLAAGAALLYLAATLVLLALVEHAGGRVAAWIARGLTVFGATFAAMMVLPQGPTRSWLRLQLAKHLFRHRYDYRVTWLRLTRALGEDAERPLPTRIEAALAEAADARQALLLLPDGEGGLAPLGGAAWPAQAAAVSPRFCALIGRAPRVLNLDALRAPLPSADASAEEQALAPGWITGDRSIWAGVPLVHGERLTGLVLIGRPALDRRLDWEDYDMLAAAGRQAASHLAEAQGQEALGEARRFHEFNRRFAFIVHDVKNLASQLGLVARNAERHAENPAFRADMIATLRESVSRLNDLLGRLSPQTPGRVDPPRPERPMAVLQRVALARRGQHPVRLAGDDAALALIDPARLEVALTHLLANAIEASPPERPVRMAVERSGERVLVTVDDEGRGMAPGFVARELFTPFRSTKPGGFGIGAYEARTLVEAMGGRLEVDSREGEGSRFTLAFPAAEPARLRA